VNLRTLGVALGLALPLGTAAQTNVQPLPDWLAPQAAEAPPPMEAPMPGEPPMGGDNCCDPPPAPVDGGLSLLALAGAGYAAHRLRRRRA
jgi:hypothetical protein